MIQVTNLISEALWQVLLAGIGSFLCGLFVGLALYPRLVHQGRHTARGVVRASHGSPPSQSRPYEAPAATHLPRQDGGQWLGRQDVPGRW